MTLAVDLCAGWVRIGEAPSASLTAIARHLHIGEWRLSGAVAGVEMQSGSTLDDVDTIRVVDGGVVVFAGFVAPAASGVGGTEYTDDGRGRRFTLAGPDVWRVLASRIAYPTPSTDPPWADSHDERTGVASTVAAGYLIDNIGTGALADRQIPGFIVIDEVSGASGSWSARLQPLDQLIARICEEGGITCRLTSSFAGAVTARLRATVDRTTTMVLSDQGDLVGIQQRLVPPAASYVVAGGQGQLTARTFATAGTATGAARLETFADQSALSTATEVAQSAAATLARDAESWSIRAEVSTTAAQQFTYLDDYNLGDTVAAEIDNVRHPVPVTSVVIDITKTLQVIRPVLGDAVSDAAAGLLSDVADLQSRFQTQIA